MQGQKPLISAAENERRGYWIDRRETFAPWDLDRLAGAVVAGGAVAVRRSGVGGMSAHPKPLRCTRTERVSVNVESNPVHANVYIYIYIDRDLAAACPTRQLLHSIPPPQATSAREKRT